MSSNTLSINPDPEKKRYLLNLLSMGLLDKEGAKQLRALLLKDIPSIQNIERKKRIIQLINNLNKYISGEINLMLEPQVTNVSNLR